MVRRIRRYVVAATRQMIARADRFGGLVTLFVLQLVVNAGTVAVIVARAWSAEAVANASDQQVGRCHYFNFDVLLIRLDVSPVRSRWSSCVRATPLEDKGI